MFLSYANKNPLQFKRGVNCRGRDEGGSYL